MFLALRGRRPPVPPRGAGKMAEGLERVRVSAAELRDMVAAQARAGRGEGVAGSGEAVVGAGGRGGCCWCLGLSPQLPSAAPARGRAGPPGGAAASPRTRLSPG